MICSSNKTLKKKSFQIQLIEDKRFEKSPRLDQRSPRAGSASHLRLRPPLPPHWGYHLTHWQSRSSILSQLSLSLPLSLWSPAVKLVRQVILVPMILLPSYIEKKEKKRPSDEKAYYQLPPPPCHPLQNVHWCSCFEWKSSVNHHHQLLFRLITNITLGPQYWAKLKCLKQKITSSFSAHSEGNLTETRKDNTCVNSAPAVVFQIRVQRRHMLKQTCKLDS